MKLTYRGIQYDEKDQNFLTSTGATKTGIIYRGNSFEAEIGPKFPWIKYIKQLSNKSRSQTVFDPIAFWYKHKREFLEACWYLNNRECDRCWNFTLQMERTKALKSRQVSGATPMSFTHLDKGDSVRRMYAHQDKLKYRGITYYR